MANTPGVFEIDIDENLTFANHIPSQNGGPGGGSGGSGLRGQDGEHAIPLDIEIQVQSQDIVTKVLLNSIKRNLP